MSAHTIVLALGEIVRHARAAAAAGAGSAAPAAAGAKPGQAPNMMGALFPFVLIFVIFYFLVIAPQRKQAKETANMIAALKRGDRVVTSGGMHGTITDLRDVDKTVVVEVAPGVRITVSRSAVASVKREGSLAS